MATISERFSAPSNFTAGEKPVVVRIKRKSDQSRLDAFWLEINERPVKRPLLEFEKLSLVDDDSGHGPVEEFKTKKLLVRHFETVDSSEAAINVVLSFVYNSADTVEGKSEIEERKWACKRNDKKEQLLSKSRKNQEVLAQNARFEQIWRSRKGKKEALNDKLHDLCHFYDVVRIDEEEDPSEMQEQETMSLEDQRILYSYVPLAREFIPGAIAQIESDICAYLSKQGCEFIPSTIAEIESDIGAYLPEQVECVYDYYTAMDDMDIDGQDAINPFPLVQVKDEDFYDGPDEKSEYDSDDSNAEAHPRNDYPDEESEEGSESLTYESSEEEKEESDDASSKSSEFEHSRNGFYEDDTDNIDNEDPDDNFNYNYIDENYS
ncbi:hypothetical protein JCGZ_01202 [Jatropha curcas]|uniref:Transcription factor Iwr1 domain-containing protein n=1 Tax=Jatropha curcas TaxID=180498 RepID=A0A067L8J3_JATCU|nr:RNA-directed DNA methylation 4 [Jatropha curcas]KDP44702.1 hypothetical protein JCGZ_01202 [Jatropha curcas]